jgi:trehalose synthase
MKIALASPRLRLLAPIAVALAACEPGPRAPPPAVASATPPATLSPAPRAAPEDDYVAWLESKSMLAQAEAAARRYSGRGEMWAHPYARPEPRAASAMASVWYTAYPASTITRGGDSVLRTLGDPELWRVFHEIGVRGMHTGPMKLSGGIREGGRDFTPTIDGNFDRIRSEIDPAFGTEDEYKAMAKNARAQGAIVIGDIIPGHSGKGADFRLAERAYKDYPGLYHMVEIAEKDWSVLPPVPAGRDAVNVPPAAVDELHARGYIVGQLPRTIFYEKGVKETDFSATDAITGVDGKKRRWVYLHYFKEGQPTFNWLDPSFAAQRLVIGDALHSIGTLGESMLRLDANGFLGIETGAPGKGERAWSEGHPLSVTSNQLIAGMVRKLGGFTFQELNLTLEDIKAMSSGGPDLSYDFVTRPAYHHALVTGDAEYLRLMLGLGKKYGIDPAGLIHALQNHDELTLELVHFWTKHKDETFTFHGKPMKGSALRDAVRDEMHKKLLAPAAPYNLKASNGVSCTTASLAAAALGMQEADWTKYAEKRAQIQRAHVLLAMYNAMQPGVFALSGWDLVGAMTLPADSVKALLADGDTRWINRGGYDLLGVDPSATKSKNGLPRAAALYGSLPEQLKSPTSFASQLQRMLKVREEYRIFESEQIDVPAVQARGLVVMVHKLPGGRGIEVTALNFGTTPVNEGVEITAAAANAGVTDLLEANGKGAKGALGGKRLAVALGPHQGQVLLVK